MSVLKIKQDEEWLIVGEYHLADVAQSGSYNDLTDTPVVDTELAETSANAISNSAVTAKFNEEIGDINAALEEIIAIAEDLVTPDGDGVKY